MCSTEGYENVAGMAAGGGGLAPIEALQRMTDDADALRFFQRAQHIRWVQQMERLLNVARHMPLSTSLRHPHMFEVRHGDTPWRAMEHVPPRDAVVRDLVSGAAWHLDAMHKAASGVTAVLLRSASSGGGGGAVTLALTGLQAPDPHAVAQILLNCRLKDAAPAAGRVHVGIDALALEFARSAPWRGLCAALQRGTRCSAVGFSLGAALLHVLIQLHVPAHLRTQLASIAIGAPRTGDAAWAASFRVLPHLNIVAGTRGGTRSPSPKVVLVNGVQVDEVTTLPLAALGFRSCAPQVLLVDATEVQVVDALAAADLPNLTTRGALVLHALAHFTTGFSTQHRLPLTEAQNNAFVPHTDVASIMLQLLVVLVVVVAAAAASATAASA